MVANWYWVADERIHYVQYQRNEKQIVCTLESHPDNKVHGAYKGAHLGQTGPRWAPLWLHELCYLGKLGYIYI